MSSPRVYLASLASTPSFRRCSAPLQLLDALQTPLAAPSVTFPTARPATNAPSAANHSAAAIEVRPSSQPLSFSTLQGSIQLIQLTAIRLYCLCVWCVLALQRAIFPPGSQWVPGWRWRPGCKQVNKSARLVSSLPFDFDSTSFHFHSPPLPLFC
ncbi:hypothetical protein M440DRAFT_1402227 [Trichoderma longibrachiatum ATCC 18648]|uniref:Uncharacterized protein n=1 Tax=Trichoderma longibrachiatum ATCC 18648 TaxID=983965 RepID=A0A2T4C2B0_TRILO|nr:hypothetical protein M440DRAFT_1402227 [Trichoderma longibrachiatum ATCC 18648]